MKKLDENKKVAYFSLVITIIIAIIHIFANSSGLLSEGYFKIFFYLNLGGIAFSGLALVLESRPDTGQVFFFNEPNKIVGISRLPYLLKLLLVGGTLAIVFSFGAISLNSAIIDVPQPFSTERFASVGGAEKLYFQSVQPGWMEEFVIFILTVTTAYGLKTFVIKDQRALPFVFMLAALVGAGVLTFGHGLAYGSDIGAYIGIFSFEFIVQLANLVTGSFISWLPHLVHNGVVSLNFLIAFSIGGTLAHSTILLWRKHNVKTQ